MYTFASLNFLERYRHHGLGIIVGRVPNSSWQRELEHENRDRVVSTKQETVFVVQGKPQLFTRISCTAFWSKVVITNFSAALTAIREGKKKLPSRCDYPHGVYEDCKKTQYRPGAIHECLYTALMDETISWAHPGHIFPETNVSTQYPSFSFNLRLRDFLLCSFFNFYVILLIFSVEAVTLNGQHYTFYV